MSSTAADHWEHVYNTKAPNELSWHQDHPSSSLSLIHRAGISQGARILDVGGGTSTLVDALGNAGFRNVGVLDVSQQALELARRRLGERSSDVEWFIADVTAFQSPHRWDLWHDRAVFHFLVDAADQERYLRVLGESLMPGGWLVLATFGPEGPQRCSGLPVMRYGVDELVERLGTGYVLHHSELVAHKTPTASEQEFLFALFRRLDGDKADG